MVRILPALALAAALGACAHVPDLGAAPKARPVTAYAVEKSFASPPRDWPSQSWWTAYGDPQLDRLMDEALAGAPTLAQARARLEKAQAQVELARGARAPQVDLNAQAAEVKQSYNNGFPRSFLPQGYNDTERVTLDAKWDADLFGRNRAALAAAVSDDEAARVDAAQARLLLTSNVVAAYSDLGRLYGDRDAAEQAIALRRVTVDLATRRTNSGVANIGEQRQAETALGQAVGELEALDEQIAVARDRLAALVGAGPDRGLALARPAAPPKTAFGLPPNLALELIGRRPDIEAARLRAEAMASRIKAAKAGFYPNINLVAFIGLQSLHLDQLTKSGSDVGQVAAAFNLPIFSGGRLEGAYKGARADYDLAVASYDQTLTTALQEVADAAASARSVDARLAQARETLVSAEESAKIARLRYEGGLSNALTAIVAEDAVINQRRAVADLEGRRIAVDAQLIRALGGGYRRSNT
jgi:NodT family efflux transporter outer membrane factor (OMF) lipoprotein